MPITVVLDPPSRQDKPNFANKADALMAALVTWTEQANDLAAAVSADETSAQSAANTASTHAADATAARDIAMAAVNYKGVWSSLAGSLAIPASAYHSGSIWMLRESVANVATETPGVSAKWINVTPASGLGTAAYADETDFQPAIGALTGLLISAGGGTISAATAAQIVAAIGSVFVQNATRATSAGEADNATAIMDGAVSTAAKIANGIITWAKHAAMTTGKLIGRSTAGSGSPEEISLGSRMSLVAGVLNASSDVNSVGGYTGAVTNEQVASSAIAGGASAAHGHPYVGLDHGSAVGTFVLGYPISSGVHTAGSAYAGSAIALLADNGSYWSGASIGSGTWRPTSTASNGSGDTGVYQAAIYQRIA